MVADRLVFVMAEEGAEVAAFALADEGGSLVLDRIDKLVVRATAGAARLELGLLKVVQSPASPHTPRKMLAQRAHLRHIADNKWHQRLLGLQRRVMP